MGYNIPSDHHGGWPTPAVEPRAQIEPDRATVKAPSLTLYDGPSLVFRPATTHDHAENINALSREIFADNVKAGWWTNPKTGESIVKTRNVPEMLCLIHSEVSEAMEGHRKDLMDDKLPHRKMIEVELADAVIRILDLCGAKGYDIGGAIAEKRAYNATRADHKIENRLKPGGKAF
jgi:hypothetical protein